MDGEGGGGGDLDSVLLGIPTASPSIFTGTVNVDFGNATTQEGDIATATVTAQPWVKSTSNIIATVRGVTTADHDPDDPVAEDIAVTISALVADTGFTVTAYAPLGTFGVYSVGWQGVP